MRQGCLQERGGSVTPRTRMRAPTVLLFLVDSAHAMDSSGKGSRRYDAHLPMSELTLGLQALGPSLINRVKLGAAISSTP